MKTVYEKLVLEVVSIQDDIIKTSYGGWQDGDNDLNWGNWDPS